MIFGTGTTLTLQDAFCMKQIPAIICMSQRFQYAPHNLTVGLSKKKNCITIYFTFLILSNTFVRIMTAPSFFFTQKPDSKNISNAPKPPWRHDFFIPPQISLGVRCVPTLQVSPPWYILRTHGIIWNDLKLFFWILELKNSHVRRDRKIGTNLKQDFKWSSIGCLWWMKSSLEGYKHYRIFTNWHSKNV